MNLKQNRPLSASSLKEFAKSPNHLVAYWNKEKETTPAMAKGSLIHCLILEPSKFEERYAIWNGGRRGTNAYKDFEVLNEGKEIIKPEDLEELTPITDKVRKNILINKMTGAEALIEWSLNSMPFKGYVDGWGDGYIFDIKTCADASPKAFLRDFVKFKYHWQAALYINANQNLNFAGDNPDFFIVAVETSAPFNSQIYRVTPEFIDKGFKEVVKAVQQFKDWDGQPAGYEYFNPTAENGVIDLTLPEWL